jgi:hypothetical protein
VASLSRWFKSLIRIDGRYEFTTLNTRARHPEDPRLERKIAAAREVAPPLPTAKRKTPKLIQENPDTWQKPIDYEKEFL